DSNHEPGVEALVQHAEQHERDDRVEGKRRQDLLPRHRPARVPRHDTYGTGREDRPRNGALAGPERVQFLATAGATVQPPTTTGVVVVAAGLDVGVVGDGAGR